MFPNQLLKSHIMLHCWNTCCISNRIFTGVLLGDELYKKSLDVVLLKCLRESKAYIALAETHEEICGSHQTGEKMK